VTLGVKRLLGSAATYIGANAINSAIPFLLLPLLTRVLAPHEYGTVTMFVTVMSVLAALTGLSVHGAVSVRFFDKDIDHPGFVGTSLLVLVGSTFLVLLAVWFLAAPLARWTQVPQGWLLVAVLTAAAQFIIHIRLVMWQVKTEALRYGVFQITQTALNLGLSVGLVLMLGMGWEGRALGVVVSVSVLSMLALYSLQRARLVRWCWNERYAKSLLRFGVPLIPHTIGGVMIAVSDRFIVTSMLGAREMGIYAAAMQVGLVIGLVADSCNKAFAPWLFQTLKQDDAVKNARIVRYTYLLFLMIPLVALLFGCSAPFILELIVGEAYRSGGDVVLYIALGGAFGGMYYLVANYVFFAGKTEWLALATLVSGLTGVAVSWWLVRVFGAVGAAQGTMFAQVMAFLLTWAIAVKSHPMPWGGVKASTKPC